MTKRNLSFLLILFVLNILYASDDLHLFVSQITEESILSYFYHPDDPDWDPLHFHMGKTREEGSAGHDSTKAFLMETLQGYLGNENVHINEFDWTDGTGEKGANIIGVKYGTAGVNSDIWIVGAHYDSYDMDRTGSAPGANDNGSGMAGVLELARIIHSHPSDATIYFCFWDAEEPRYSTHSWVSASSLGSQSYSGPSGSRAWINSEFTVDPFQESEDSVRWQRVKGNINLDMFGFPAIENTLWLYHGGSAWNSSIDESGTAYPVWEPVNNLYMAAASYLETYGYDDREPQNYLTVIGKGTMQYSDNISFSRAGIPSLEYSESDWNSDTNYHLWSDYYRPSSGDASFSDENPKTRFMSMVLRGVAALLADTTKVDFGTEASTAVVMADYKTRIEEQNVFLQWRTASENENLGFRLERKKDQNWCLIDSYLENENLTGFGTTTDRHAYAYVDSTLEDPGLYEYRLSSVDYSGQISSLGSRCVLYPGRDKTVLFSETVYPNPFNSTMTISYRLSCAAEISITVFDINGRQVESLLDQEISTAGDHQVQWCADNISSGVYLIQIQSRSDTGMNTHVMKFIHNK